MPVLLVVDDEEAIRNAIARNFSDEEDIEVVTAGSAPEAVRLLGQRAVDVIISDERMPVVAGSEFLRFAKDKYPDIPRIILTGYADPDATLRAINKAEVFRYLAKPWAADELIDSVRKALAFRKETLFNKTLNLRILSEKNQLEAQHVALESKLEKQGDQLQRSVEALKRTSMLIEHYRVDILNVFLTMANFYDLPTALLARRIGKAYTFICTDDGLKTNFPHPVPTYSEEHYQAGLLSGLLTDTRGSLLPLLQGMDHFSGIVQTLRMMVENYNATGPQGFGGADIPAPSRLLRILHDYYKINAKFPGSGPDYLRKNALVFYDPDFVTLVFTALPQLDSQTGILQIEPERLVPGMVAAATINLSQDLIIPEGTPLDNVMITRIQALAEVCNTRFTVAIRS